MRHFLVIVYLLLFSALACNDNEMPSDSILEEGEQLSGGDATVYDLSVNAFGNSAPNLSGDKDLLFVTGNAFFKRNWVTAPSSTEDLDGLGPVYNSRSCSGCHNLDGRGRPPLTPQESPLALLFRISAPGIQWKPVDDDAYGGQLQNLSILGIESDGDASVSYVEVPGSYPDGTWYSLRKPVYTFILNHGDFAAGTMVSARIAPHLVGLGLLEAVDESQLLMMADPEDNNHDGISGRLNHVWDVIRQASAVGRFGWKANQPSIRQQVAAAFNGDIGITSDLFPLQPCGLNQKDCNDAVSGGQPELSQDILDRVVLYSASLAVPRRRDWDDQTVLKGKLLFREISCSGCHVPKIVTGSHGDFPEFMNQTIYPYTDLLLHDMGEGLADHRPDFEATGKEWRTPPLWGIGLIPVVNGHSYLLHDGRARNIEEAILWHAGEAEASKKSFKELSETDREAVIRFVESL